MTALGRDGKPGAGRGAHDSVLGACLHQDRSGGCQKVDWARGVRIHASIVAARFTNADSPQHGNQLVGFQAQAAGLHSEQGIRPKSLLQ